MHYPNHSSVQLSSVKYVHITMQPSPRPSPESFSSYKAETLYPLNSNSHDHNPLQTLVNNILLLFIPFSVSGGQHSTFCYCEFSLSFFLIAHVSEIIDLKDIVLSR